MTEAEILETIAEIVALRSNEEEDGLSNDDAYDMVVQVRGILDIEVPDE